MMNELIVDFSKYAVKFGIDETNLDEDTKELLKYGVDFLVELTKSKIRDEQEYMSMEYIGYIKKVAIECNVDKVVRFPILMNNKLVPATRIYGGDIKSFASKTRIYLFDENIVKKASSQIDQYEKEYGKIIYERA